MHGCIPEAAADSIGSLCPWDGSRLPCILGCLRGLSGLARLCASTHPPALWVWACRSPGRPCSLYSSPILPQDTEEISIPRPLPSQTPGCLLCHLCTDGLFPCSSVVRETYQEGPSVCTDPSLVRTLGPDIPTLRSRHPPAGTSVTTALSPPPSATDGNCSVSTYASPVALLPASYANQR